MKLYWVHYKMLLVVSSFFDGDYLNNFVFRVLSIFENIFKRRTPSSSLTGTIADYDNHFELNDNGKLSDEEIGCIKAVTKVYLWLCKIQHLVGRKEETKSIESKSPLHSFVWGMKRLLQTNLSGKVSVISVILL
jgi:hypothetical protein